MPDPVCSWYYQYLHFTFFFPECIVC
jgi:hypothetical protein